ncbi:hypothetical protein [Streptomyces sp. NPDC049879]|uniref:hypothetical protein n=1 Tax=Streptomyces sp. NPDC049879 TaxID=3365598 RepID=UPI0037B52F5F
MVTRDLFNVRPVPAEGAVAPLTEEEERRYVALLFKELGDTIADQGWARYPAWTREDRRRLVEVARRLSDHWGREVFVAAEDESRLRLWLAGHEEAPARS